MFERFLNVFIRRFCHAKMPDSYSDLFSLQTTDLTLKDPLLCSFVQFELRTSKTYWIRQNFAQSQTDVQNLENILRILFWLSWFFNLNFLALWEFSGFFYCSKWSPPLQFFWYFATKWMLLNPKKYPLLLFSHYATFSERKDFFLFPVGEKVAPEFYRACKAPFGCLETVSWAFHKHVLGIFKKLFAFCASLIAPTVDVII